MRLSTCSRAVTKPTPAHTETEPSLRERRSIRKCHTRTKRALVLLMLRPLEHVPTHERTDEELERAFDAYARSKTVNGRFCPTPDLCCDDLDTGAEFDGGEVRPSRRRCRKRRRGGRRPSDASAHIKKTPVDTTIGICEE
jgi:hypothetical protein